MPKTVVGLFEDSGCVGDVVRDLEAMGFPRNEVRTVTEPATFEVTGVMSFPRLDFEVDLARALARIGVPEVYAQICLGGLRSGGALVFATGSDGQLAAAADAMDRYGAVVTGETTGAEPQMPHALGANMRPMHDSPVNAGRTRQSGDGARLFAW